MPESEKSAILDHLRYYHGGPHGSAPRVSDIVSLLPAVFAKIAGDLECYVKQLEKDEGIEDRGVKQDACSGRRFAPPLMLGVRQLNGSSKRVLRGGSLRSCSATFLFPSQPGPRGHRVGGELRPKPSPLEALAGRAPSL